MKINQLVEEVLSEAAVELLNALAAHALVATQKPAMYTMAVEADNWNSTMMLVREIFEAEVLIPGETEWLGFRILESVGVKNGQLAYQFTPIFAQALA